MVSKTTEWRRRNPGRNAVLRAREVKNPEVLKRATLKFRELHLERVRKKDAEAHKRRREDQPEMYTKSKKRQQISYAQKREMEAGRPRSPFCEICCTEGKVVFDHCHASGMFRGWICDRCNKVLGHVKDSPSLLRVLASYLEPGRNEQTDSQGASQIAKQGLRWPGTELSSA